MRRGEGRGGQERGEKVPNTRNTRATYFCKSGFIRKARVVRRDVELPELPILYKKTFKRHTHTHTRTRIHIQTRARHTLLNTLNTRIYIYIYIYTHADI